MRYHARTCRVHTNVPCILVHTHNCVRDYVYMTYSVFVYVRALYFCMHIMYIYILCIHVICTYSIYISYIHIMHVYILYIHIIYTCSTYISVCMWCIYTYYVYILYIHIMYTYYIYILYIHMMYTYFAYISVCIWHMNTDINITFMYILIQKVPSTHFYSVCILCVQWYYCVQWCDLQMHTSV